MRTALTAVALASFAAYYAAIGRLFSKPEGMPPGMRLVLWSGTTSAVTHIAGLSLSALRPVICQVTALAIDVCGLALFLWAWQATKRNPLPIAFSQSVPHDVFCTGPYSLIRHPFYTAYAMTWIAGVVATTHWVLAVSALWMICLYVVTARREERRLLGSHLGQGYRRYSEMVSIAGHASRWRSGRRGVS